MTVSTSSVAKQLVNKVTFISENMETFTDYIPRRSTEAVIG